MVYPLSEVRSLHIFQENIWSPFNDVNVVRKNDPLMAGQLYPRRCLSDKSLHDGRCVENRSWKVLTAQVWNRPVSCKNLDSGWVGSTEWSRAIYTVPMPPSRIS